MTFLVALETTDLAKIIFFFFCDNNIDFNYINITYSNMAFLVRSLIDFSL